MAAGEQYFIDDKLHNKITKAVNTLNKIMMEVRETYPEANWYLEDSANLNLLVGDSHKDNGEPNFHNVIDTWDLWCSSGGGW